MWLWSFVANDMIVPHLPFDSSYDDDDSYDDDADGLERVLSCTKASVRAQGWGFLLGDISM